jgi:hypothetical protein
MGTALDSLLGDDEGSKRLRWAAAGAAGWTGVQRAGDLVEYDRVTGVFLPAVGLTAGYIS